MVKNENNYREVIQAYCKYLKIILIYNYNTRLGGREMPVILLILLQIIVLAVVVFGVNVLLQKFVYSRVRINKFIPLAIAIILFVFQFFYRPTNVFLNLGLTVLVLIFFLWFLYYHQGGRISKQEKKQVIRPKAKPNRAKNLNKDNKK